MKIEKLDLFGIGGCLVSREQAMKREDALLEALKDVCDEGTERAIQRARNLIR